MKGDKWSSVLDAIADGMEMRLHMDIGILDIAIRETANLAHRLDIPDKAVQRWAKARKTQRGKTIDNIELLLNTLKANVAAQKVFCDFLPLDEQEVTPGYDNWKMN